MNKALAPFRGGGLGEGGRERYAPSQLRLGSKLPSLGISPPEGGESRQGKLDACMDAAGRLGRLR